MLTSAILNIHVNGTQNFKYSSGPKLVLTVSHNLETIERSVFFQATFEHYAQRQDNQDMQTDRGFIVFASQWNFELLLRKPEAVIDFLLM